MGFGGAVPWGRAGSSDSVGILALTVASGLFADEMRDDWERRAKRLPYRSQVIFRDGKPEVISMPWLTSAMGCVVYALFLRISNKWGLADRIRTCLYRENEESPHHHFLAQVAPNGVLLPGYPQKFCCSAHSNAFRQRTYRGRAFNAEEIKMKAALYARERIAEGAERVRRFRNKPRKPK
jgi:hypothetical protein